MITVNNTERSIERAIVRSHFEIKFIEWLWRVFKKYLLKIALIGFLVGLTYSENFRGTLSDIAHSVEKNVIVPVGNKIRKERGLKTMTYEEYRDWNPNRSK